MNSGSSNARIKLWMCWVFGAVDFVCDNDTEAERHQEMRQTERNGAADADDKQTEQHRRQPRLPARRSVLDEPPHGEVDDAERDPNSNRQGLRPLPHRRGRRR